MIVVPQPAVAAMPAPAADLRVHDPFGLREARLPDGLVVVPGPRLVERQLHEVVPEEERTVGAEEAAGELVRHRLLVVVPHPHAGGQAPRNVAESGDVAEVVRGPGLEARRPPLPIRRDELGALPPQQVARGIGVALEDVVRQVRLGLGHRMRRLGAVVVAGVDHAVVAVPDLDDRRRRVQRALRGERRVGLRHVREVDRHRSERQGEARILAHDVLARWRCRATRRSRPSSGAPTRNCIWTDGMFSE